MVATIGRRPDRLPEAQADGFGGVIETVMIFALGFLLASLCALLFLPTLNRRSARLARKRIDTMFPMSIQEITAERDYLRAEFAVSQRRMERKVEEARNSRQADMSAIGARTLEIAALSREIEHRDAALNARKLEIEEAFTRITSLDRDLAGARSEGAVGLAALTALEDAHREILTDIKSVRRERDAVRRDLRGHLSAAQNDRAGIDAPIHASASSMDIDEARLQYESLLGERDALRASLSAAEDALARTLAEARVPSEDRDDAELRRRISEIADALTRRDHLPATGAFVVPATAQG